MRRILCFLLFGTALQGQVLVKVFADSMEVAGYSGGDEFSGATLNEQMWHIGLGWTRVLIAQDLAFPRKNVVLDNGMVRFVAKKEDSLYTLQSHEIDSSVLKERRFDRALPDFLARYSAGCILTKRKLHYGTYVLRFRAQPGRGIWPAFWFYGGQGNEEIDVFELKGERTRSLHVDAHCPGKCERSYRNRIGIKRNWGTWLKFKQPIYGNWHEATLEWTPKDVTWYFNGVPVAYYAGNYSNPMNLYLNTSVARDGGPFSPGPDETTTWPNYYDVDFLRIYQPVRDSLVVVGETRLEQRDTSSAHLALPLTKKKAYMHKRRTSSGVKGLIMLSQNGQDVEAVIQGRVDPDCVEIIAGSVRFRPAGNKITAKVQPGHTFRLAVTSGKKTVSRTFVTR